MKYVQLQVDGSRIDVELRAAAVDVAAVIGLDSARTTSAEVVANPATSATVTSWLAIRSDGRECKTRPASQSIDQDPRFVSVRWQVQCDTTALSLTLDLESFFSLDSAHSMVLSLVGHGSTLDTIIGVDDSPLQVQLGESAHSTLRWLTLGIHHILGGADHICFLLALLLAAVIGRKAPTSPPSEPAQWRLRSPIEALRLTAALVTSFSIAHSVSLIAATLGWLALPSRWVETAIAASILYAAVENLVQPSASWRWALVFFFGLIHGLGFASALHMLLPADHLIVPLVMFNLGVEIGQLLIVAFSLPCLIYAAMAIGVRRYRTIILRVGSLFLLGSAIVWIVERAFALTL